MRSSGMVCQPATFRKYEKWSFRLQNTTKWKLQSPSSELEGFRFPGNVNRFRNLLILPPKQISVRFLRAGTPTVRRKISIFHPITRFRTAPHRQSVRLIALTFALIPPVCGSLSWQWQPERNLNFCPLEFCRQGLFQRFRENYFIHVLWTTRGTVPIKRTYTSAPDGGTVWGGDSQPVYVREVNQNLHKAFTKHFVNKKLRHNYCEQHSFMTN